jgi:hypothetical protein
VALLVGWLCEGSEGGVSLSKGVIKGVECYCWVGWSRGSFGSRGVDRFGRRKEGRKEGRGLGVWQLSLSFECVTALQVGERDRERRGAFFTHARGVR